MLSRRFRSLHQLTTNRVIDDGFDIGSRRDVHPAFEGWVREVKPFPRWNSQRKDTTGHGTLVAGAAVANGYSELLGGHIRGTAPDAELIFHAVTDTVLKFNNFESLPMHLQAAYDQGSRVVTISIVNTDLSQGQSEYDHDAGAADDFIRTHPDLIVVVAAGNAGEESGGSQITGLSAAKNCITVGACSSARSSGAANSNPGSAVDHRPVALSYSSRGPTKAELGKPDVSAPGHAILSTASRDPRAAGKQRPSGDQHWSFASGTSFAAPLVAGCVAVIREMLCRVGEAHCPSVALIKALLINGATPLSVSRPVH